MDVITIGESMILFTPITTGPMRYKSNFESKVGGAESNVAIGLSRLEHKVGWISRLGNDEFGKKILTFIRGEGVDVSQVALDSVNNTGLYFKEIVRDNEVNVHYYRKNSAASFLKPSDLNKTYLAGAKYLHVTGITPILSETCYQTIKSAIDIAKENGVQVVFDPNIRKKLWSNEEDSKKILLEIAANSDIVLPGIEEGKFLSNETTPENIAKFFYDIGVSVVVLKLGEKGAYYHQEDDKGYVAPFPVKKVIDPIGAGDGFAAGFLSGLLDGLGIYEAVKRGAAIGSIVTTVEGDVEGLPDRDQLYAFLSRIEREDVHR
ncbi:sugar kinase [Siminovitchia sp. 179-K 8D1 HS]|uniref:sugar kinase n=1 Tax=Siminovitchia sp. 179-K 8D1 HS TaxID=3142385 RepID=UPI0039A21267